MQDRQMNIRVYHDGRIVVSVFAPALLGMARTVAGGHTVFTTGWPHVERLIDRAVSSWDGQGLDYSIHIRHQGVNPYSEV